ncbi:uncharacterized protein DUF3109 [Arcticibacter pallidicorallinus]|uniref:Uncharacterized protein DUF3109 n=1 Tax=Arcticibacter pallidicorallinus TaxID=1259464 RepID=A0A2T0TTT5_9SPHI|nr:DUF3109 family protein [Arcticibacter pallidicorallinus]PRY49122.1 uncharacterized protein DUF3109 [Arcticibacter pallidicorallinus]
MLEVQQTLVHEDVLSENFVCNLDKCKGACCVEGDSGAPLEMSELKILEDIYPHVKPYMTDIGIATIERTGTWVKDFEGDYTTPCVDDNKECAYVMWENGISKCAIERAYLDGKIHWKKPISCHLYPIRVTAYPEFDVLNYDRWHICKPACSFGKELKIPVYRFLKEPLIRKYGEEWYTELETSVEGPEATI